MMPFVLKLDEEFPRLSHPPVTEAVLELRARAETEWREETVTPLLKERLPTLPKVEQSRGFMAKVHFAPGAVPSPHAEDLGWLGLKMSSEDAGQIANFHKDRFAFNQLAPYPGWSAFLDTAMNFWRVHTEIAAPSEIARIGLRFINRIELPETSVKIEDYLIAAPKEPRGLALPFSAFLHQDVLAVPGHDYSVRITRTIQPPTEQKGSTAGLILDLDVSSTKPWAGDAEGLRRRLHEMRWLKNKAFFGSLTDQAQQNLR